MKKINTAKNRTIRVPHESSPTKMLMLSINQPIQARLDDVMCRPWKQGESRSS